MTEPTGQVAGAVRPAGIADAGTVAALLHDFNVEFDVASPGVAVLAGRLRELLGTPGTSALLVGEPAVGVALMTRRRNVWYAGEVVLLDELYVQPGLRGRGFGGALIERLLSDAEAGGVAAIEINVDEGDVDAQRFYRRHGFSEADPDSGERAFYFSRELRDA